MTIGSRGRRRAGGLGLLARLVACAPAEARLLVGFEKGVSAERHAHIVKGAEGRIAQRFKSVRGGRLSVVESHKGVAQAVLRRRLAARDGIAYVENDDTITAQESRTPDDRYYPTQYALVESAGDAGARPAARPVPGR